MCFHLPGWSSNVHLPGVAPYFLSRQSDFIASFSFDACTVQTDFCESKFFFVEYYWNYTEYYFFCYSNRYLRIYKTECLHLARSEKDADMLWPVLIVIPFCEVSR